MDYSWLFIGAMAGLLFGTIFIMVGFIAGGKNGTDKRHNQSELPNDNTDGDLLHVRSGSRSGNNRRNTPHTVEEKVMVLNTFRMGATWFEKCILDEVSDDLIELDAIKFLKENEDEYSNRRTDTADDGRIQ